MSPAFNIDKALAFGETLIVEFCLFLSSTPWLALGRTKIYLLLSSLFSL